jgi:hypothetical protein
VNTLAINQYYIKKDCKKFVRQIMNILSELSNKGLIHFLSGWLIFYVHRCFQYIWETRLVFTKHLTKFLQSFLIQWCFISRRILTFYANFWQLMHSQSKNERYLVVKSLSNTPPEYLNMSSQSYI